MVSKVKRAHRVRGLNFLSFLQRVALDALLTTSAANAGSTGKGEISMVQRTHAATAALYEIDETAWLEATADLIRNGRLTEVDRDTLAEYLTDMAKRDRREV